MNKDFLKYLPMENFIELKGGTRAGIFTELIDFVAARRGVNPEDVFASVMAREKVMSTAVGGGLAIPHGRMAGFGEPMIVMGICRNAVQDYESLDGEAVRLVLLVLVDYRDSDLHLSLLRGIAGTFLRDPSVVGQLAGLTTPAEFLTFLKQLPQ